jgi:hypothetical protein
MYVYLRYIYFLEQSFASIVFSFPVLFLLRFPSYMCLVSSCPLNFFFPSPAAGISIVHHPDANPPKPQPRTLHQLLVVSISLNIFSECAINSRCLILTGYTSKPAPGFKPSSLPRCPFSLSHCQNAQYLYKAQV